MMQYRLGDVGGAPGTSREGDVVRQMLYMQAPELAFLLSEEVAEGLVVPQGIPGALVSQTDVAEAVVGLTRLGCLLENDGELAVSERVGELLSTMREASLALVVWRASDPRCPSYAYVAPSGKVALLAPDTLSGSGIALGVADRAALWEALSVWADEDGVPDALDASALRAEAPGGHDSFGQEPERVVRRGVVPLVVHAYHRGDTLPHAKVAAVGPTGQVRLVQQGEPADWLRNEPPSWEALVARGGTR